MTVLSANAQIGLPEDFTSADLAMFTDAEVAAMRADPDFGIPAEDPATQVTQEADPVDPALSADQQAAIDANGKAATDAAAADATATAANDSAGPTAATAAQDEPLPEPAPAKLQDLPDTIAAQAALTDLKAARTKLVADFNNADIGEDEFNTKLETITDQLADAQAVMKSADIIRTNNANAIAQTWYGAVKTYMDRFPELKDPAHLSGFDAALKSVNSDASNGNLTANQRISLAHGTYVARLEALGQPAIARPGTKAAPKVDPVTPAAAEKLPDGLPASVRKDPRPAPVTIADISAASPTEAVNSRFAEADRLLDTDPLAGEQFVATFSKDERNRYLSGAR